MVGGGGGKTRGAGQGTQSSGYEGRGIATFLFSEDPSDDEDNEGEQQARAGGEVSATETQRVEPFEPPPLPRRLLAGRLGALEKCVEQLSNKPEDPRAQVASERLARTKQDPKIAGGRTSRRLFFSLVNGEERIKKFEKELEEAKGRWLAREEEVVEAIQAAREAEFGVEGVEAKLQREKAIQAHRGFEAAAETSQEVEGFEGLAVSLKRMGAILAQHGVCESEWNHVARFISFFSRCSYASSEDSDIKDLRSAESGSTHEEIEVDSTAGERASEGEDVAEEQRLVQLAFTGPGTEKDKERNLQEFRQVQEAAGAAARVFQATAEAQRKAVEASMSAAGPDPGTDTGTGEVFLAIMDAVDHAVPSSSDSNEGAREPRRKRRGREVQVAGGATGNDVCMEKKTDDAGKKSGRVDEETKGESSSETVPEESL